MPTVFFFGAEGDLGLDTGTGAIGFYTATSYLFIMEPEIEEAPSASFLILSSSL